MGRRRSAGGDGAYSWAESGKRLSIFPLRRRPGHILVAQAHIRLLGEGIAKLAECWRRKSSVINLRGPASY